VSEWPGGGKRSWLKTCESEMGKGRCKVCRNLYVPRGKCGGNMLLGLNGLLSLESRRAL